MYKRNFVTVLDLHGKVLVAGGCRSRLCEQSLPLPCVRSEPALAAPKGTHCCHEQCWLCVWESRLKKWKNCCTIAAGREEWEMWEKQPCRHQGQCRRGEGGAPGWSIGSLKTRRGLWWSRLSPLQPLDNTWSRSPCAALKELTVQQQMRPEGGTAHGELLKEQPWAQAAALERSPRWTRGRRRPWRSGRDKILWAGPSSYFPFSCAPWHEEVEEGEWGQKCLQFAFSSYCSILLSTGSKLH